MGRTFLSTPSARRATTLPHDLGEVILISIHALREEGDRPPAPAWRRQSNFYPRPPRGGRPRRPKSQTTLLDFYPRPPRGGRRPCRSRLHDHQRISIHALREEGDLLRAKDLIADQIFLSTPSARRATRQLAGNNQAGLISIHALREEGDKAKIMAASILEISIHALREEGDV